MMPTPRRWRCGVCVPCNWTRCTRVVDSGRWQIHGFRSPHAWLTTTTGEAPGQCTITLHLAERIQHMPITKDRFANGVLPESALRLLADAWNADIADVFTRDEPMLVRWATDLCPPRLQTRSQCLASTRRPQRQRTHLPGTIRLPTTAPVRTPRRDGTPRRTPRPRRHQSRPRSHPRPVHTMRQRRPQRRTTTRRRPGHHGQNRTVELPTRRPG